MRITTINDEATLDELVDRVHGAGASKNKDVREAFLELNPHLAEFEKLPAGTPVVLPSNSAAGPAPDPRTQNAITQTQQAVTLTRGDLDAGTARAAATAKASAELLNDPKIVEAVHGNSDAEQRRTEALQALKDDEKQWNDVRDQITGALAGFEETLKNWSVPPQTGGGTTAPPDDQSGKRRRAAGKP